MTERLIRRQYRICKWRHDVPKNTYSTPYFEGKTVEECDQKALAHFESLSARHENGWDGMDIVRIDMPAVAEKVTFLTKNGRQELRD